MDLLGVIAEEDPIENDLAGVAVKWLGFRRRAALGDAGRDATASAGPWGDRGARAVYKRRRLCGREWRHKLRARGDIVAFSTTRPSG